MTEVASVLTKSIPTQEILQQVQAKLAQAGEYGQKGELEKAQVLCKEILTLMPEHPQALHFLGMIALQRNEFDAAISQLEKVAPVMPFSAEVQLHLGVAYGQKAQTDKAINALKKALSLNSKFAEAHYNLGLLLLRTDDFSGAQTHYQRAVKLNPENPTFQMGMGSLYFMQNKISLALESYAQALKLQPHYPECYFNMARALEKDGRMQQALESYYKALELNPSNADALNAAGALLMSLGQHEQAIAHFKNIIEQAPQYVPAFKNYGDALIAMKKYNEAAVILKQGLEQNPEQVALLSGYYTAIRNDGAWQNYENARNTLLEKVKERIAQDLPSGIAPYLTLSLGLDAQTEFSIAQNYAKFNYKHLPRHQYDFSNRDKDPNRRLKIGYVLTQSQDPFLASLMTMIIPRHNRDKFAVHVYGSESQEDVENFTDISFLTTTEISEHIYEDEIDILIDLNGYLPGARPEIFISKPAPVQIGYLGYLGTSGGDFIDYYLGDAVITPSTFESFYSESFLKLPNSFCASDHARYTFAKIPTKAECGLPENKFIFSSAYTHDTLEPKVFASWLKILALVPDSVLWLFCESSMEARLRQFAQQNNVEGTRLIFASPLPEQQISHYQHVDLFLDTPTYNAHHVIDVLGMNVPVLSILGNTTATRTSASFLTALKLEDLLTNDIKDYTQKAVSLAQQPDTLTAIKDKLISNKNSSGLFDTTQFINDLENLYQKVWQENI